MTTKIFCDIAELVQIKKFNKKKIVKGFTTNPSLMRKAGAKDYKSYSKKILNICSIKDDTSAELLKNYPLVFNVTLDQKLDDVNLEDPGFDPVELKEQMTKVMIESGGIGLTASQVGLTHNVFVMGDSLTNSTLHINPTVLQYTEEKVLELEGCLSFPNIFVKIPRPKEILAEWYDENLEKQTVKIEGYSAKCYLHELDHLLGITFKDRASKLKWNMATKKAKKLA